MIQTLQVIGLVPPQYVLLSRRFYVFPLFPFHPLHRPDCLIYNNTLLDPFQLCLLVSYPVCYYHALLVTGYGVLLSTLQGNLSFSTSSVSSFASTHAGPDFSSSLTLRLRHHAL